MGITLYRGYQITEHPAGVAILFVGQFVSKASDMAAAIKMIDEWQEAW